MYNSDIIHEIINKYGGSIMKYEYLKSYSIYCIVKTYLIYIQIIVYKVHNFITFNQKFIIS
jgi:hypothetical protein